MSYKQDSRIISFDYAFVKPADQTKENEDQEGGMNEKTQIQ